MWLIRRGAEGAVLTFDVPSGRRISSFPTTDRSRKWSSVGNLCLSPDGTRLAMVSSSTLGVDIWNPDTGQLLYSLPDQEGAVWWLAWNSDSRRLACSRSTGDISIWNMDQVEQTLADLGFNSDESALREVIP